MAKVLEPIQADALTDEGTWFAVYDMSATNRLVSIGSDTRTPEVTLPLGVSIAMFSDTITPQGSRPDLELVDWNMRSLAFDPKPARVPTPNEITCVTLLAKDPATWTLADVATAVQIFLKGLRVAR